MSEQQYQSGNIVVRDKYLVRVCKGSSINLTNSIDYANYNFKESCIHFVS
jgi:hypothetical protein